MTRLVGVWLAALGVVAVVSVSARDATQDPAAPRVIEIKAERFVFFPSEVRVAVGERVEIRLSSDDTGHGFKLVGTDTDLAIPKRGDGDARLLLTATAPGRLTFECSRLCGAGHNFMRGVIVVEPAPGERQP